MLLQQSRQLLLLGVIDHIPATRWQRHPIQVQPFCTTFLPYLISPALVCPLPCPRCRSPSIESIPASWMHSEQRLVASSANNHSNALVPMSIDAAAHASITPLIVGLTGDCNDLCSEWRTSLQKPGSTSVRTQTRVPLLLLLCLERSLHVPARRHNQQWVCLVGKLASTFTQNSQGQPRRTWSKFMGQ